MPRFVRHACTVSLLTLLSRITGLARDASFSRVFGAGGLTDAFFFAFMIPNLFRRLFGEGALSAAFLPTFARLEMDDPATARRLASLTVAGLTVALGLLVLVSEVLLFFLSQRTDHTNLALWLMMVMLPYMPLVCLVAIFGAMLQVRGRFGPTAAAPIVLNSCLITAILVPVYFSIAPDTSGAAHVSNRLTHIGIVAGSVVFAGALQVAWSLFALRREQWWDRDFKGAREPMRDVLRMALPMILGLGVLQLNTLFDGLIASYPKVIGPTIFGVDYPLREGAMAAVSFAQRFYQFPLGVFGIAVATAIFPALAREASDPRTFAETVRRGLRLVLFIGLPASAGLILVRAPLTAVLLEGGDFTQHDTARVSFVLLGYAPAIWAYSMMHVLTRAFYALGDSKTPVKVAISVVLLNLALNCSLIWTPLREAGLAWSTAICACIQVALLLTLLRRRVGALVDVVVLWSWAKTIFATTLMAGCVVVVALFAPRGANTTWTQTLLTLVLLVGTGTVVFVAGAAAMKMPELPWAVGRSK